MASKMAINKPKDRKRSRRYNNEFHPVLICALMELGRTDAQIAQILEITVVTLWKWRKKPAVIKAIKDAKEEPDAKVERSLFERACGFSVPEEKVHFMKDGTVVTHVIRKYFPADTAAAFIWLKNRRPEKWRDKTEVKHTGGVVFQAPEKLDD